jgi:hypothetical protein
VERIVGRLLFSPAVPKLDVIAELRREARTLRDQTPATEDFWTVRRGQLQSLLLDADPWGFLRWNVIATTMVKRGKADITQELRHLQRRHDWTSRWRPALRDHTVGLPRPFYRYPRSSGDLIHHAYHTCRFEEVTGVSLATLPIIVEFGGGYGSMCRTLHQLGFMGTYLIFDLPELSAIQRFFLSHVGIRTERKGTTSLPASGVVLTSDVDDFKNLLRSRPPGQAAFIATWSLSEAPVALRTAILSELTSFDAFLLAYGEYFEGVDNRAFFAEWRRGLPDHSWHDVVPVSHVSKPAWYMFGAKNSLVSLAVRHS